MASPRHLTKPLLLASQSPRRQELLHKAGFSFESFSPDVEEAHDSTLTPAQLTEANACLKAMAAALDRPEALVLAADTLVYLDEKPLGKPTDLHQAAEMLRALSGRTHQVCTGCHLAWNGGKDGHAFHEITTVTFRTLSAEQIRAYHQLVTPLDKAGAYGIQEHGNLIIDRHEGSWTNVMGLPMERLLSELTMLAFLLEPEHSLNKADGDETV